MENKLNLRRSNYFPTNECKDDDSLKRKEKEAKAYFEKNLESLEKDYREHLENAYVNSIEYDHETYEKTGRINLKFSRLISSFSIEEASGKPFEQLKFYIKPSRKQVDLIEKAQDHMDSDEYILRMNIDLYSSASIPSSSIITSSHLSSGRNCQ
ncbi:hypothetical protein [Avibacterium paragallinarum]|uniref:hypothetical protein n=1 Tax=Avibacterium paragallinarum TaxID=728 RepID=UPI00397E00A0